MHAGNALRAEPSSRRSPPVENYALNLLSISFLQIRSTKRATSSATLPRVSLLNTTGSKAARSRCSDPNAAPEPAYYSSAAVVRSCPVWNAGHHWTKRMFTIFWARSCLYVNSDSVDIRTETSSITLEIHFWARSCFS
jgi:hypothetical protein